MALRTDNHLRAGLYARVSTEDRGQNPETQLRPLREYAERRGFSVVGEFVDHASGTTEGTVKLMGLVEASRRDGPGPCPHRGARPVRGSVAGAPSRPPVLRVLPGRRATRAGTVRGGT